MKNNPVIYTVTVIDMYTDKVLGIRRTPGIFTELRFAQHVVRNNTKDLSDGGLYQYAVIEETLLNVVRPCVDMITPTHWWYKYNSATEEFEEFKCPPQLIHQCGFGIG
jgi:hypothetical protein